MKKNVSGQKIGAQMITASDGSAFTGSVTVYVTGDAGTQAVGSVGSGACTHEGNGYHTYAPAQAETNYDLIAFTFIGTGAIPATVQIFTGYPQTGDNYARLGAPAGASVSADIAAVKTDTAAILLDTGTDGVVVASASKTGYSLTATTGLGNQTANITGNLSGSVGSVTGAVGSVTAGVTVTTNNDKTGYALSAAGVDAVWDEATSGHVTAGTYGVAVTDIAPANSATLDRIEFQRGHHTVTGSTFYVDGTSGNDTTGTGSRTAPVKTITKALTLCTSNAHDQILLLPNSGSSPTTITETATITITKNYVQIRGPGRDVNVTNSSSSTVFDIQASGVGLSGFRVTTSGGGSSSGVLINSSVDFVRCEKLWIESAHQDAIRINVANRCEVIDCHIVSAARDGVRVDSGAGSGEFNKVTNNVIRNCTGSGVNLQGSDASYCVIRNNLIRNNGTGVTVASGVVNTTFTDNRLIGNSTPVSDSGTGTLVAWNYLSTDTSGLISGISGTIQTLDALDTEQDTQHSTTQGLVTTVDAVVDAILTDTAEIGVAGAGLTNINLPDQTMNITGDITGNLSGSVGSVTGAVGSVTGAVGSVTGLTNATIADQVWDEVLSGHLTAGSTGNALNAAGAAGDPWSTSIPGAYGAGTAGYIVGNNIDAAISSRSTVTTAQVNSECDTAISDAALATAANLATVDTVVDAIKAKTDSLTFTKAGEVDANLQSVNDVTVNGDGSATPMGV
jgi:hypothetical protein